METQLKIKLALLLLLAAALLSLAGGESTAQVHASAKSISDMRPNDTATPTPTLTLPKGCNVITATPSGTLTPTATPITTATITPLPTCTPATGTPSATNTATPTPFATLTQPPQSATPTPALPTNTATLQPPPSTPTSQLSPTPRTPTVLPTLTNTPVPTATATPTPAITGTPVASATPTSCPLPFVDLQGNIFYSAIYYLYCQHIVSGTDSTHFSPAGQATRGQFAKIVVLGFGLAISTPAQPTFSDVPPSYFAYIFIESAYADNALSGYDADTCGRNRAQYPCFLPNRSISRGEMTSLVVRAANYPTVTPPGGGHSFIDVLPSNVFYIAIETGRQRGIVSGYSDGTFRPNNAIRRDEMAQVVYKALTIP